MTTPPKRTFRAMPLNEFNYQRPTICVDARRTRYCAEQLRKHCKEGTKAHGLARAIIDGLDSDRVIDFDYSWSLERLYRRIILKQTL
jgi:hypothetical protein